MVERLAINGGTPVRRKLLPWELPGAHWIGKEELALVSRVLKARSPFRYYGIDAQHMVDQLEAAYRKFIGRKHALGVSSATAGLHVALGALGIGPGDEVLLPGYLWCSCISAVIRWGAIPRLVDINETFCMDPEDLRCKITPRSKVVMIVHMSGAPGQLDALLKIARQAKLKVLEDCAQCNGAKFHGKRAGRFGDVAVYSFQANKNMTSGEGGMIVCDDDHLYRRCFALHDMGFARNEAGRLDPRNERYQLWGTGARMSELTGAMALAQLRKLDRIVAAMRNAKWQIRRQIADLRGLGLRRIVDPKGDSGPFLIMSFATPEKANRFSDALKAEGIRGPEGSMAFIHMRDWGLHWYFNNRNLVHKRSISANGWPWTHPANAFAKGYRYGTGTLPVTDDLAHRSAILSIASCLPKQDIRDMVKAIRKVAQAVL